MVSNIDFTWYLSNQIHPPVARLCAPIEGTDIPRLANCLGLDISKYQNAITGSAEAEDLYTFESTIPEAERFKDVEKWKPRCNKCGESHEFLGFFKEEVPVFLKNRVLLKVDSSAQIVPLHFHLGRCHVNLHQNYVLTCANTLIKVSFAKMPHAIRRLVLAQYLEGAA